RSEAHRDGQRPVLPARALRVEQMPADQIRSGHILMASDGDERLAQTPGHILDEAGFAASGGPFQHHGHAHSVGGIVQVNFLSGWPVVRLRVDAVLLERLLGWVPIHVSVLWVSVLWVSVLWGFHCSAVAC